MPTPCTKTEPSSNPRLRAMRRFAVALALVAPTVHAQPAGEPIQPIPLTLNQDPARAALGRQLFDDKRLSANGKVSCATCHDLDKGASNGQPKAAGLNGVMTPVNVPTLYNAAFNFRQFWNGRADSLEAQIGDVLQNKDEMGSNWPDVVRKLQDDAVYRKAFAAAYADGVTRANVENALASYERTLITPNSRFDRFLRGDAGALTSTERAGYDKFKRYGCVACHQGVNVGGNMYQKFGVMGDYFAARGKPTEADQGRYLVTRDERDRHVFKVPSLRNVALTAPYFHDGSAATLEQAVDVMFRYQLGRIASPDDKTAIVAFLKTLTGERVDVAKPGDKVAAR